VFTIGIDPHKGSHVAAVLDEDEEFLEELCVCADRHQREWLLKFAASYTPRVWAIEGARGLGALLAQQLVAVGETVVDVPAKLSARCVRSITSVPTRTTLTMHGPRRSSAAQPAAVTRRAGEPRAGAADARQTAS
jgi:hypothetical protein